MNILTAFVGSKVKFNRRKWDNFQIKLEHSAENVRCLPCLGWIPYFWDTEIVFDMGISIPKEIKDIDEKWDYTWELRDLGENLLKNGKGEIVITKKGIRRKLQYWNTYKKRAIVLGNLHPHKEYLLYVKYSAQNKQSENLCLATLTVEDRTRIQFDIFIILFTVIMTLIMTALAKGCGL